MVGGVLLELCSSVKVTKHCIKALTIFVTPVVKVCFVVIITIIKMHKYTDVLKNECAAIITMFVQSELQNQNQQIAWQMKVN